MNISIENMTKVFVMVNAMNEAPMIYGLDDVIIPTNDSMFTKSETKTNLRFPKYLSIFILFVSKIKVNKYDAVYNTPTYLRGII